MQIYQNLIGDLTIMKGLNMKPNFSALSRKYNIDRHTIKKYYVNGGKVVKSRNPQKSKYDQFKDEILYQLEKPEITIMACYQYLKNKYPETSINYSGLKSYTLRLGYIKKAKAKKAHVRYETKPGEQLQVDWKENISITTKNGKKLTFNILTATLGYSRFNSFIYSKTKTTEDFIRCVIDVFNRLGGIPKSILTDNMTSVVSIKNGIKRKHQTISQFEKDTNMTIKLCKVKSPQTKGKCESANRFINWLKAYENEIIDESDLIEKIRIINNQANAKINQTTNIPPNILFEKEKEHLSPLVNKILLDSYISNTILQVVQPTLLVSYKGAQYSVPKSYINCRVKLVPIENQLYIYYNTKLIVIHEISTKKFNYQESHYKEALAETKNLGDIESKALENLKLLEKIGIKNGTNL